jgi:hypothetical protein
LLFTDFISQALFSAASMSSPIDLTEENITPGFSCGATMDEARERIYDLIGSILPEQINASKDDEEAQRLGLCMEGKLYQEIKVTVDDAGEVRFPSTKAKSAA